MKAELDALADRVEALAGPDRETDVVIGRARGLVYPDGPSGGQWGGSFSPCPYYTASLDAAMTLVPEGCLAMVRHLWDGAHRAGHAVINRYSTDAEEPDGKLWIGDCYSVAHTPALALTAAAIRALAAEKEVGE